MTSTVPRMKRKTPVPEGDFITLSVRMPGAIYNRLSEICDREDRVLNAQIIRALREWLDQREAHVKD